MRLRLASVLFALLLFSPPLAAAAELPGWKVMKTAHSYPVLVERLEQAIADNKMGLVSRASATLGAKRMLDKTIPGNMVIGVYRPDFAVRMLEVSLAAGIEAPIRFYVTENADGSADLSYKTPSAVFAPYADGGAALKTLAVELDEIFAKIAAQAAGT
ncbi:DUF302 domain-containing protein [Pelagibius litoralis]|uniref:DUF302 domain-containing protein n=1 Tax=Pelagibius litoralis TaxID=374515 RepID=A0A967C4Z2_9PROT|nr:DUF302 domain-containing protein [Pelagibius litoralis]NIA68799.1 DUF302 domain-containing protein [Pelagibius litoralis]